MKVSIITCTWNSAATLEETIRTVQAQDHPCIEHIFVDGGSTDGTLDIIAALCPGARILAGVQGGISRAMNAGAQAATGDLLAHLHSDDYYFSSDVVSTASRAFVRDTSLQWLYGRITVLRDSVLCETDAKQRVFSYARFVRGAASVPHPAVFMRTSAFFEMGGFNTDLKYAMDIDLWLRLGRKYFPLQIDRVFTVFREHAGSLSTANVLAARAEEWQVRKSLLRDAPVGTAVYGLRYWRRTARIRRALALAKH